GPTDRRPDLALSPASPLVTAYVPRPRTDTSELEAHDLQRVRGTDNLETDEGVFVATVAPDGSVTFRDRPNLHGEWQLPSPGALGRRFTDWAADPYALVRQGAECTQDMPERPLVCPPGRTAADEGSAKA